MSDRHYYYLLDGKEHGPFTRAAIDTLQRAGKLGGAFFRDDTEILWQTPEELGWIDADQLPATKAPLNNLTSSRPQATNTPPTPTPPDYSIVIGLVAMVAISVGVILYGKATSHTTNIRPDPSQIEQSVQSPSVLAKSTSTKSRSNVCSDYVVEMIGPAPNALSTNAPGRYCFLKWNSASMQLMQLCHQMKETADESPEGSRNYRMGRAVIEQLYQRGASYAGQYAMNLAAYCR